MPRHALPLAFFVLCALSAPLRAEPPFGNDPLGKDPFGPAIGANPALAKFAKLADVNVVAIPAKAKWGETVTVKITIAPKGDGHTYPVFPKDATQDAKNSVVLPPIGDLIFIGTVTDP